MIIKMSNGHRVDQWLRKISGIRSIVICVILVMAGGSLTTGIKISSKVLDMKFGYTYGTAYNLLANLGSSGRAEYVKYLYFDYLFILILGAAHLTVIAYILKELMAHDRWNLLLLLPVARGILDFIENCLILNMLFSYPKRLPGIATAAGMITRTKWITMYTIMAIIVMGIVLIVIQASKNRNKVQV